MRGNVDNLPKWARQEIERLDRDVEHLREKLEAGPEESNTFADPYSDSPRPLGHDVTIGFVFTDGGKVRVTLERDPVSGRYSRLDVNGDDPIVVLPSASNSVHVEMRRR